MNADDYKQRINEMIELINDTALLNAIYKYIYQIFIKL